MFILHRYCNLNIYLLYSSISKLWALRRMHFAFLPVDERLAWYRSLLREALSPSPAADADADASSTNSLRNFFGRSASPRDASTGHGGGAALGDQEEAEERAAQLSIVNPRNCVGTVLAINGARRYFCMYEPFAFIYEPVCRCLSPPSAQVFLKLYTSLYVHKCEYVPVQCTLLY